jgi:hypothetical protein
LSYSNASLFFILFSSVAFLSCKKQKSTTTLNPGSEYFPNTVGDYWKYKYVDSSVNTSSYVDINIIGTKVLPGGQNAKIWTYTFPSHVDTNFVYQDGNTIKFVNTGLSIRNSYVIPFSIGTQWRTNPEYVYDSIQVLVNNTYTLNNHAFENSFLLFQYGHLPDNNWTSTEWFCPNIEMLTKNDKNAFLIAATVTTVHWELIDYSLK